MSKPQLKLKVLPVAVLALLVPSSFAFGVSFIDLGHMDGGTKVVAQESRGVDTASDSRPEVNTTRNITVSRTQINGDSEGFPRITPDAVNSEESLQSFASSTVYADANIESITFTNDRVELVYKQSERLLALMPVGFDTRAMVYADGRVDVSYPWYKFLLADRQEELRASIESVVGAVIEEHTLENSDTLTPQVAAEVAWRMHAVLRTEGVE